jgi:hypothetical protein
MFSMRMSASAALRFKVVGGLQLLQRRLRLLERVDVLLRLDLRDHRVLDHLELGSRLRALRDLDLAVVLRRGRTLLRLTLPDLLFEVGELGAAVERVGELLLPVELDHEVSRLHGAAGRTSRVITSDCGWDRQAGAAMVVD